MIQADAGYYCNDVNLA